MKHKNLRRALVVGVAAMGITAGMAGGVFAQEGDGSGSGHPIRHLISDLTDEQRQCLRDADLTKPPADATDDERLAAREAFLAALDDCGIELPERRGPFADLTDEQLKNARGYATAEEWKWDTPQGQRIYDYYGVAPYWPM